MLSNALISAAASSVDTYGGQGGSVVARTHEAGLPMTGQDVIVLAVVAAILLVAGMAMAHFASTGD